MTDAARPARSRLRPTMPCATCDHLLWWFKGYTLGVSRCQDCRRGERPAPDARPCAACGVLFTPSRAMVQTCSRRCGGKVAAAKRYGGSPSKASQRAADRTKCARRRARIAAQVVEDVDPDVVFERDGWRCHICRRRIDRRLSGMDAMGPTLDHLVPLCEGGEHSYANVAAAHRRCNSSKGRRGTAQLALIG